MMKCLMGKVVLAVFVILIFFGPNLLHAEGFLADHTVAKESVLRSIPVSAIQAAKDNLHILYVGTSHSSQLMTGMRGLMDYKPGDDTLYGFTYDGDPEPGKLDIDYNPRSPVDVWSARDLSHDSVDSSGHTGYYYRTIEYLDHPDHADVNVVMWSWCSIEGHNVQVYLDNFEELINIYRAGGSKGRSTANEVKFVFMTGYARGNDGDDPTAARSPYNNARAIKQYCLENGHYCIDYWSQDTYDYETDAYNPHESGNANIQHYTYTTTHSLGQDWFECRYWFNGEVTYPSHTDDDPTYAQHLTGNRRAYAAWYVWARLGGWTGGMANQAPYVEAGDEDIIVLPNTTVSLNGDVSDDGLPQGNTLQIEWRLESGPGTVSFSSPDAAATEVDLSEPGIYVFELYASDGELSESDTVTIMLIEPDVEAPSVPQNLSADSVTSFSVELTWDESTDNVGVSGYEIFRDGFSIGTSAATGFSDAGLSPLTEYLYTVKAFDLYGNYSEASISVSVVTLEQSRLNTIDVWINSVEDDAEERGSDGTVSLSSSDLELVREGGNQIVGVRFNGIDLPKGAVVVDAYLEFETDGVTTEPTSLVIAGEANGNASAFSTEVNNILNRARTASFTQWNDIAPWNFAGQRHQTPDISHVVQEIINRVDWAYGNSSLKPMKQPWSPHHW